MSDALCRGTTEGAQCDGCPFSTGGQPTKPVVSEYPEDPAWILLGEGPGITETRQGRPFIGSSGQVVNQILRKIGRQRDHVFVGNVTLCQPPQGSPVEDRERAAECCKPRLTAELAQLPGKPILTLGAVAARSVIPKDVLDAIDPPDVPKTKKRAQKDKQKAERKENRKRKKAIEKIAISRFHKLEKTWRGSLTREFKRRVRAKPDNHFWEMPEQEAVRRQLWKKALEEAPREYEQKLRERALAKTNRDANKAKKPKKKKPIKITDIVGTLFDVDVDGSGVRPVIPAIHPAALLHGGGATIGGSHTPDMAYVNLLYDALKVDSLAKGRNIRLSFDGCEVEVENGERATQLFVRALQSALETGRLSLDLETYVDDPDRHHALMAYVAKIRVIGLATDDVAVAVAWDLIEPWAFSYFQLALMSVALTTHHGLYDRTVLRAYGFILPVVDIDQDAPVPSDTLYAHHAAFPGNSHKLQIVASQFYGVGPWKCLRGDVDVLLPNRSTISIRSAVSSKIKEVLSYENGKIVPKRVIGWHKAHVPGQEWVRIETERCDRKYTKGLIVTPDHKVMTSRGLVEASSLRPLKDRIAVDEPAFSDDQISAALGTLLGDSSIFVSRVFHKDPWKAARASLRGGHANKGLRDCKVQALALGTSCKVEEAHARVSNGVVINASTFYSYGTTWAFQYMDIARLVYDDNWKRRIKIAALNKLGRRGLAMMFMDDGDLRVSGNYVGAGFATNGFPIEDVELFADWLRNKYQANVSIYNSRGPYTSLSSKASKNMLEDLRGYIHPSVGYKTIWNDEYKPVQAKLGLYHALVTNVSSVTRSIKSKHNRTIFDNRYCLTVEDTKLFFTNYGLVSNSEFRNQEETLDKLALYCAKDTLSTHRLRAPLEVWVKRTETERVYHRDRKMMEIASRMHLIGQPVSREVNSQLVSTFTRLATDARKRVEEQAADPKVLDRIKHKLALLLIGKKRKKDEERISPLRQMALEAGKPFDEYEELYKVRKADLEDEAWYWKINNSKHIAALLQALDAPLTQVTDKGQISTKREVLEELVADVAVVRDLMEYRENDKMLDFTAPIFDRVSANGEIESYGFADENDRIHPIWLIHKISGRWAGTEPMGTSNPPREKTKKVPFGATLPANSIITGLICECGAYKADVTKHEGHQFKPKFIEYAYRPTTKRQIVAKNGRIIIGFDFAQVEARVIALISGDPFMCDVFSRNGDLHTECAIEVFPGFMDKTASERKMMRTVCKTLEYATWYGAADEKVWKGLIKEGYNFKKAAVVESLNRLRRKMNGVIRWQRDTIFGASQPPYELRESVSGRRRVWPMGQVEASEALNSGPQFTASAIMNEGVDRMDQRIYDRGYKEAWMISQIHDAAYYEIWEDDADRFSKDLEECFESERTNPKNGMTVRFPIEVGFGSSMFDV